MVFASKKQKGQGNVANSVNRLSEISPPYQKCWTYSGKFVMLLAKFPRCTLTFTDQIFVQPISASFTDKFGISFAIATSKKPLSQFYSTRLHSSFATEWMKERERECKKERENVRKRASWSMKAQQSEERLWPTVMTWMWIDKQSESLKIEHWNGRRHFGTLKREKEREREWVSFDWISERKKEREREHHWTERERETRNAT